MVIGELIWYVRTFVLYKHSIMEQLSEGKRIFYNIIKNKYCSISFTLTVIAIVMTQFVSN